MNQNQFNNIFVNCVKDQSNPSDELLSLIIDSPKLSAKRAIEVYQEDYMARLTEALKNTFRATYWLIGEEDFKQLALDYIAITPSISSDLDDYGETFSDFCLTHELSKNYLFLASLARFEWDFRLLFHKKNIEGLSAEDFQLAIAENKKLTLTSTCKLLSYDFLISELYALKDLAEENNSAFDYKQSEYIVIYKKDQFIMIKTLNKSQWEFLKQIETPQTILDWISSAQDKIDALEIQELFEFLSTAKLISSCDG